MPQSRTSIRTRDGLMDTQIFTPSGLGPWPAVIFYMDALAIRPALEEMADRLAQSGYCVLLPDLFYRSAPVTPFNPAEVFKGGPERDRLMAVIGSATSDRMMRDTAAMLDFISSQTNVVHGAVGTTGYCMGGRIAMLAAGTFPDQFAADGLLHSGGLATDKPDSPHLLASKVRARLYIGVAAIDHGFSDAERERVKEALDAAGVRYTMEVYPTVSHGFCVPDLPVYDKDAAERHWKELMKLLAEALPANSPATASA
jgi:carboxymethylenebutenolidase